MAVDRVGYGVVQAEQRTVLIAPARHRRLSLAPWIPWACEVLVALLIAGGVGGMIVPRLHTAMEWAYYRSTVQELATTIHGMRWRALSQHRAFELRADPAHGSFQLVALEKRWHGGGIIERTIWLPRGLQITEAPSRLLIGPTGRLSAAHVTITAAAYNKAFHLLTTEAGTVRCDEEPEL